MQIKVVKVGGLQTNCYIVSDERTREAIVIDPGDDAEKIKAALPGLKVKYIVITHGHYDHVGALGEIIQATKAPVLKFPIDAVRFGGLSFLVLHTPGHTKDSICLYAPGHLFSGDTLFSAAYGRTDLPGGSPQEMRLSLKGLAGLPDDTIVYPGHDETTTIGLEKERGTLG